ncbi:MAG TPA: ABC transporter ATP-binding protein [Candidatus Dojkabacteria bacterium]|nr:ABC transporter ATP-binding protein [Candidatus Dojkabacteria bacterium]
MDKNVAIEVKNLSKTFYIPDRKRTTLVEYLKAPVNAFRGQRFEVLKDISFKVNHGETLAIMGNNGSGKSTLLKILAEIYVPDEGKIHINGSLVPFLELGVGFNPELTGYENIYLNGIILGMTKKFIEKKFDEIVDFAEIREFLDLPLKNYSTGMQVRLAFSIAFMSHADIYLLDEVFAVGDLHFQEKCRVVFKELKEKGKTIIFVSHSPELIKSFCDKAILLDEGKIVKYGNASEVADLYVKS